jgi:hypothetical protein
MHYVYRLRRAAKDLLAYVECRDIVKSIQDKYGIEIQEPYEDSCVKTLSDSLERLPPDLVRDCGVRILGFENLGPSAEFFPNHGRYADSTLILNTQLIDDPLLIVDPNSGAGLNKFDQTLYHELGHGWDDVQKESDEILSLMDDWKSLSGWTQEAIPGHKRIRIREKGHPEVIGEFYYSPDASFTRFYAKRNPWDDWADSFAYYVAGLKSFLPENKVEYFNKKLGKYYKGGSNEPEHKKTN